MKAMRKLDLINKIVEATEISKVDVLVVLDQCFKEIKEQLMIGKKVTLRKFGTFKSVNNKNKDYVPVFIPSEELNRLVAEYLNEETQE